MRFGPFTPPPLALRGHVLSVDPKWKFVVLDLGQAQKTKPTWKLLVSRGGQLVAKVEIVAVEGERSVANIIPGWQFGEIREGDVVLPAAPRLALAP